MFKESFWAIVPALIAIIIALVSKEVFNKVQSNVKRKQKTQTDREKRLFENP